MHPLRDIRPIARLAARLATSCLPVIALLTVAQSASGQKIAGKIQQAPTPLGPTVSAPPSAAGGATAPVAAPATATLTAADASAWLDGYMPYALATGDIAGAVVVVVQNGEILMSRGYGYADVARRTPVDPARTLFRPGSVSKLVTWTAVMQQVESGKIDLDADVNRYLDFRIPPRDGKPITMRQLMQHVAGFEEQVKGIISTDGRTVPSYDALLKQWTPSRIYPPGTTPAYSNYGASLAGYIVQRVSGESFEAYVERHIFAPLAMTHSTFRQPLPPTLAPLASKGYKTASMPPTGFEIVGPAPAGSMSSTGEDMGHFMIAHLADGAYHGTTILQPATARMMHDSPLTMLPPLNRMELGFFETNINGREVIGHLGDTEDFHTSLHLFMKENVGFYVSFNSAGKAGAAGTLRIALFRDFADRYFPGPDELSARIDSATAAQHAAMMTGSWIASRRAESNFVSAVTFASEMKVSARSGRLELPFPGLNGGPRKWLEVAPFVWRDEASHERIAAKVENGKVVRFSFDELSPFTVYDRAPWFKDSAWLMPLFILSLVVLALTVIRWPAAALVRRHYRARLELEPRAMRAYRWSRIAATAMLGAALGWAILLGKLLSDLNMTSSRSDPLIHFVQLFSMIAFVGGAAVMLWNLWVAWSSGRRWPAKVWSIALALSALTLLWVGVVFKLTTLGVNY